MKANLEDNILQQVYDRELENRLIAFKEAEKLYRNVVEAGKQAIDEQHREKLKLLTAEKRIHRSALINHQQMRKATIKYKMCEQIFASILQRIDEQIAGDEERYCLVLIHFIVEGALRLFEPSLTIRCLPGHQAHVQRILEDARQCFSAIMEEESGRKFPVELSLNTNDPLKRRDLDSQFSKQQEEEQCIGGVILADQSGNITYKNTLDARVNILREVCLPDLRAML